MTVGRVFFDYEVLADSSVRIHCASDCFLVGVERFLGRRAVGHRDFCTDPYIDYCGVDPSPTTRAHGNIGLESGRISGSNTPRDVDPGRNP